LDTEGITIPETPPPIPDDPSNYDFAYNYWDFPNNWMCNL
jgi:hypothetical protein